MHWLWGRHFSPVREGTKEEGSGRSCPGTIFCLHLGCLAAV
jgi:hypothetical protein